MLVANSEVTVNVSIALVFGVVTALLAASRGRSPIGWFLIGLILSCFGLILLLVLPDLKQQEDRDRRQHLETRRLREQLAKERQVADHRHAQVERRIGAHDQALGLDTGEAPQIGQAAPPPPLPDGSQWFYARGNERLGPVSTETIRHLLQAKALTATTLVWRDGMANWADVGQTPEFRGDVA